MVTTPMPFIHHVPDEGLKTDKSARPSPLKSDDVRRGPVENVQIGELATIDGLTGVANVRDTIFQKYVAPPTRGVEGFQVYVAGGSFARIAATLPARARLDADVPM